MKILSLLIITFSLFFMSCATNGYVKFENKQADMVTTGELKAYLNSTQNPSVVLRVPNSDRDVTKESSSNFYQSTYNTIEKELLRAGFNVRDRSLFNQILNKTDSQVDYSELQARTDTDLILELVDIDSKLEFTTNTYYTDSGEKETLDSGMSLTAYGAKVEFKVVLIKNNQYAGSYIFFYEPCANKCPIKIYRNSENKKEVRFTDKESTEERNQDISDPYQYVSQSAFEAFIKDVTKKLIDEMGI